MKQPYIIVCYFALFLNFFVSTTMGQSTSSEENVMIYGEVGRPRTLDPITNNDMVTLRLAELIFDGLVGYDRVGETKLELADRVSEDGLTYTFHIRPQVRWQKGGRYVTAQDVASTYQLIKETPGPFQSSLDFIESVHAPNSETVVIKLSHPVISPKGRMAFKILPKELNNPGGFGTDFKINPNGTGPYKVDKFTDSGVQLSRHIGPVHQPQIEKIIMRPFQDVDVASFTLLQGQMDLLTEIPIPKLPNILRAPQLALTGYNALSYACIGFNLRNPILADKRIRQAFTYAFSREGVLETLYHNYGELISGPFPPNSPGYNKSIEPFPYAPEKAKQLLEEAGFTLRDRNGYRMNSKGQQLEFDFKVPATSRESRIMTTEFLYLGFVDAMKEIGVKINLKPRPWTAWKDEVFNQHDFDLAYIEWSFGDLVDITTLFHSKFTRNGGNNIVGYVNPKVDELLNQSKEATLPEQLKYIYHELHRIIHDDCPYIFLWSVVKYASYNLKLRKVTIEQFSFFDFIDEWYIEGKR